MNNKEERRARSNSYPSVKEYIKRARVPEEEVPEEKLRAFQRSKKTIKSPVKENDNLIQDHSERQIGMEELKDMIMNLTGVVNRGFKETNQEIKENIREVKDIKEKLDGLETRWSEERQELKREIQELVKSTEVQESRIEKLEIQLERNERERKMCNIVIKNFPNTGTVTCNMVEDFLKRGIQTQVEVVDAFNVGRMEENRVVVVAKLRNYKQKMMIMENKSKLKGTKTYIEGDMTSQEREIQNKIWIVAREAIKNGDRVKVGYQRMYNQEKLYVWDKKEGCLKLKSDTEEGQGKKSDKRYSPKN